MPTLYEKERTNEYRRRVRKLEKQIDALEDWADKQKTVNNLMLALIENLENDTHWPHSATHLSTLKGLLNDKS